ncbi:sugar phosphate isomerase/epimerase [Arthrobacter sp. TES]|jgi:D-psicose/D-tagatose/L-ribulose 3-epimerase|uniref:sugar phosphate isomerase/epimerase family protein n=1 Tax=Paenarthrobacter TaxID=1742992 RepID=UPI000396DA96|nr:sugar phosphate isomerase/epimerase family protein [Paenarthrobacter ureafaciens]AMB41737.1 hypothetical protein AUT26_17140 [Arthrobacter sp. ATCC 21022]AOY69722.1 hypothetical protein ARZXY2_155 [Arthrobacter sp. ZXY-2]ERI37231.1 hypothetical protein M707_12870 [Arthrobacter sp. AK-YN10]QOI62065.1 sugar phosphate isomerase/epimerase [Arthrobacter sp. TES]BCW85735.1 epimerase [Arthrobacter sp. NicSoilE8]
MSEIGLHMLVYTPEWNESSAKRFMERAAAHGYDFVEVLIFEPSETDALMTARLAEEFGLGVVAAICGTLDADISSSDPEVARRGEARIASAIPLARDMGATMIGGPTYSAINRYLQPSSPDAVGRAVEAFSRIADSAQAAGVRVGLEAVNRYESNFINTIGQAADVCRQVGSDALFVHGDVFHMNIEEPDISVALPAVRDVLGYLHVTESNRGIIGTGNFKWQQMFETLAAMDYQGPITFESFSPSVVGPELSSMLALWEEPWTDPEPIAADSLSFIKQGLAAARAKRGLDA